ncbi:MAG: hypothetical protein ACR2RL_17100 [Gammaproteobacteria bacterium]
MNAQTTLYALAGLLGLAAMIVGALGLAGGDKDLLPVAIGIFVSSGIVVGIAMILERRSSTSKP